MKTIPRFITKKLADALKVSPVVFLNGARQSGKSTLVQSSTKEIWPDSSNIAYVTLDRPTQMAAAAAAPELMKSLGNPPLTAMSGSECY